MDWQSTPYTVPLVVTFAICLTVAVVALQRRRVPGAIPTALLLLAAAEWALAYLFELASPLLTTKVVAGQVQYLAIATLPATWLAFALQYTGAGPRLTRRTVALMLVEPAIVLLLVWTNSAHGLIWTKVTLDTSGPFPVLSPQYGVAFWLHAAYAYVLMAWGTVIIFAALVRTPQLYRRQAGTLIVASALPWISNALYLARVSPFPGLDLTPFSFAGTGVAIALALWQLRLLDLVPIARGTVVENMQEGVLVVDAQNRVVDINPAAVRGLGVPGPAIIGRSVHQVFGAWQELTDRYGHLPNARFEHVVGAGAEQRAFDVQITPLTESAGQIVGRLVVWRDVTEHKQADIQLRAAKDAAEAATRAKSAFLANMSHELRTPLNAILGFAELIHEDLQGRGEVANLRDLERVQGAAHQLLGLIHSILDFSKVEAGKMEADLAPVSVPVLIEEVATTAWPLVQKNRNTLDVDYPPDLGPIETDGGKLRQILLNLLSNAAKFTTQGTITLRVSQAADGLHFSVSDTGIGVDMAQLPALFEPFTQADTSTTRRYGGAGLGLALSRELCTLLGGEIRVVSRLGAGSTFTVVLPVQDLLGTVRSNLSAKDSNESEDTHSVA